MAKLELPEGRYHARVGRVTKQVLVKGADEKANTFTIRLEAKDAPPPQQGTLYAWVHEHGVAVVDQPVMVARTSGG